MPEYSLRHHMERSHGIFLPNVRGVDVGGERPETYKVLLPRIWKSLECPVEGCLARSNTLGILRENFMYLHWKSKVDIMQERTEPLPQWDQCGMYMPEARIFKHRQTDKCNKATDIRLRVRDVEMKAWCGEMYFSMEGGEGDERVEVVAKFWCLVRPQNQTEDDWPAVRWNIVRSSSVWGGLGTLLRR